MEFKNTKKKIYFPLKYKKLNINLINSKIFIEVPSNIDFEININSKNSTFLLNLISLSSKINKINLNSKNSKIKINFVIFDKDLEGRTDIDIVSEDSEINIFLINLLNIALRDIKVKLFGNKSYGKIEIESINIKNSKILSLPALEIKGFSKIEHNFIFSSIDKNKIFYLQSKGIPDCLKFILYNKIKNKLEIHNRRVKKILKREIDNILR